MRQHGLPVSIILYHGLVFTSHFLKTFQDDLGTRVDLSILFHPQNDGQSKKTIQVLKDMLHSCVIYFCCQWEQHLNLADFSYNNIYHSSIDMSLLAALNARYFCSPVGWFVIS